MKNKISDLNDHLFEAIERLNDPELKDPVMIEAEIKRAQAIANIGNVLVNSAKTSILFAKVTGKLPELKQDNFLPDVDKKDLPKIERPAAVYSNKPLTIANG